MSGSGEQPRRVFEGRTTVVNEVLPQPQNDLEIIDDANADLVPSPASIFPRNIYRIYDEVNQEPSVVTKTFVDYEDSVEQDQHGNKKERVEPPPAGPAEILFIPVYSSRSTTFEPRMQEPLKNTQQQAISATNRTRSPTIAQTLPSVPSTFVTTLLSAIDNLVEDDSDWENPGERTTAKTIELKKKSYGVLGPRVLPHKKEDNVNEAKQRSGPLRSHIVDSDGRQTLIMNQRQQGNRGKQQRLPLSTSR
ncbi:unnamed protein product [Strongylus vulgaris]|uniref:Uncharacterized protein n=1 Tax=Strongylus vulgaris TaxID=40348 RepID=A0A3P7LA01_STRVU|nr:unnamed protein product [Strongylus vulgaris]